MRPHRAYTYPPFPTPFCAAEAVADAREGWVIDPSALTIDKERLLGRGGFGDVFAAKYLGSTVACKVVRAGAASQREAAQGFLEEVTVMTKLHHPNIVMVMGIVSHQPDGGERQFWVVTELMAKVRCCAVRCRSSSAPPPTPRPILRAGLASEHHRLETVARVGVLLAADRRRRRARPGVPPRSEPRDCPLRREVAERARLC